MKGPRAALSETKKWSLQSERSLRKAGDGGFEVANLFADYLLEEQRW